MASGGAGDEAPEPNSSREAETSSVEPAPDAAAAGSDAHPGPSSPEDQVQAEPLVPEVEMIDSSVQEESDGAKEPPFGGDQSEIPSSDPMDRSSDSRKLPKDSAITNDVESSAQPTDARTEEVEEQPVPNAEATTQQAPEVEASTHPDSGVDGSAAANEETASEEHAICHTPIRNG